MTSAESIDLEDRQRRLEQALSHSRAVAWEWNPVSNSVTTSGSIEAVLGLPVVETVASAVKLIHPDDLKRHAERVQDAIDRRSSYEAEYRMIRPSDGEIVWVEERATTLLNSDGSVRALVGLIVDITDRRQIEDVLRSQAQLLNLTFDAIIVRDFETDRIKFWNLGATELYGYSADEAIGLVSHQLLGTVHPVPVADAKAALLRSGRWEGRLIHTSRTGETIHVESRWALQEQAGAALAVLETNTDITAKREAENRLLESEEGYRTIVETASEGVWVVDAAGTTLYVNRQMANLLGHGQTEMNGSSLLNYTFPGDDLFAMNRIRETLNGATEQFDFRFRHTDGHEVFVIASTSAIHDSNGLVTGALGLFTDVTDRRRLEVEKEVLLNQVAEGIVIAAPEGDISYANPAARQMLGLGSDQEPRDPIVLPVFRKPDGSPFDDEDLPISRALSRREVVTDVETVVESLDGRSVNLGVGAAPLLGVGGENMGAIATFRDNTQLRRREEEKAEFLTTLAHDLKTPLTVVRGTAQMLRRRGRREGSVSGEELDESLVRIERTANRMSGIINEFLDVARLEAGESLDLRPTQVDLVDLVSEVVDDQRDVAGSRELVLDTDISARLGLWDRERLTRVVMNLLSNAVKYSPDGSRIMVKIRQEESNSGPQAVLVVRDEGIGIPEADLPHIFERFRRGGNVGGSRQGTGIGLSGARQIVEQHGAALELESREGAGTTVTIRLPVADRSEPSP